MPPTREKVVALALRMDRIKSGKWYKKTDEKETGDEHDPGIKVKLRRVNPGWKEIQTNRTLFENGGCIWQVIDETGSLMANGYESPSGYLLVDGVKWLVQFVTPTAKEVVLLTGCYKGTEGG